jgi:hypothetical protein
MLPMRGDDYGERDGAMQWLLEHDPDAGPAWAASHGIIDATAANRIRRREVSIDDPDIIVREQHIHCPGCKDSQRRHVHA